MNSSAKLWASVSGVSIATAVVIGSIAAANQHSAPKEAPAGQMVSVAPVQTVTSTVTASATPTVTPSVSPSTKKAVVVKPRTVQRQEAPVSNTTTSNTPVPDPQPANAPGQQLSTGPDGHIIGAPPLPPAPPTNGAAANPKPIFSASPTGSGG